MSFEPSMEDLYWEKGITDKTVKTDAYKRSLDSDVEDRLPLETYLEVVEMKKIVENRLNWPLFKDSLQYSRAWREGACEESEMDGTHQRTPANTSTPARERKYKVEDFQYIDFIHEELMKRIKEAQANPVLEGSPIAEDEDA